MNSENAGMKIVSALLYPWHLHDLERSLLEGGVKGMTITSARAFGGLVEEQKFWGSKLIDRDRIKVEVIARANQVEEIVTIFKKRIMEEKGVIGTCLIEVSPVSKAIRIRTGEEKI